MKIEKTSCPYCGANLKIRPGRQTVDCSYCGSTLLLTGMENAREDAAGTAVPGTENTADVPGKPGRRAAKDGGRTVLRLPFPATRRLFPPPGFRTGNISHMILAVIGYLAIFYIVYDFNGLLDSLFLLIGMLSVVDICTDWTGWFSGLTGLRSKNPVVRIVMKTAWSAVVFTGWTVILVLLQMLLGR
ncbi:MAG: hypothetical protein Q4D81_06470 [Eubacteriales bacterium]|nr:hypothetical protein [Eubacteriales bacterium]